MIELVVATGNKGKLKEIREALSDMDVNVISVMDFPDAPEVEEDGDTFLENATKKAVETAKHTGMIALADDSGLVVDALEGRPGVYSARYAGEDATDEMNNEKLLAEMEGVPDDKRTAWFVAVIVVATPEGEIITAEGKSGGTITHEPTGDKGFGYDPLFYNEKAGKTFAEMEGAEKLSVSHRGAALREMKKKLPAWLDKVGAG